MDGESIYIQYIHIHIYICIIYMYIYMHLYRVYNKKNIMGIYNVNIMGIISIILDRVYIYYIHIYIYTLSKIIDIITMIFTLYIPIMFFLLYSL
jgi:hypothetical protein